MKLPLVSAVFAATCAVAARVEVYQLDAGATDEPVAKIPAPVALSYLADRLGVHSRYKIADLPDPAAAMAFLNAQYGALAASHKPKLVVSVAGARTAEFSRLGRSFEFSDRNGASDVYARFPEALAHERGVDVQKVTPQIRAVASSQLARHFADFTEQLGSIWRKHTAASNPQVVFDAASDASAFKVINDKFFIAELTSLIHLNQFDHSDPSGVFFVHLQSLQSLMRKTGAESSTYNFANRVLAKFLGKMAADFDVIVVSAPEADIPLPDAEVRELFRREDAKSASGACFASEAQCSAGTESCNSHGKCVQAGQCWTCACEASFNKTSSRTTHWAGFDCGKKDVSSTANLLLWSSLAIAVLFVGGIQLLMQIGNEPLPGVLDAASSKST